MNFDSIKLLKLEQRIQKDLKLTGVDIPIDINISTITMEAKLNVIFNPLNIYLYVHRDIMGIQNVKKASSKKKRKPKKNVNFTKDNVDQKDREQNIQYMKKLNNKKNDEFLNQVTAEVYVSKKTNNKPLSVKIFRNGTLHFTGCQSIDNMLEATYKICVECSKTRAIVVDGKVTEITFVDKPSKLILDSLHSFSVDMINSNFKVPFKIDRPKLYTLFKSENRNVTFDSNKHAAVKFVHKQGLTIFIFESGSIIIIVGNNGFPPIVEGFNFIYHYLLQNYDIIVKDDKLTDSNISKCMEERIGLKKIDPVYEEPTITNVDELILTHFSKNSSKLSKIKNIQKL